MKRGIVAMLLLAGSLFAQQFETIMIPTRRAAAMMPAAERRELELVFGLTIEEALKTHLVLPGEYIDFRNPVIRFRREYNLWMEMRSTLVKKFGFRIFREAIDIKEMTQFDRATTAWEDYCVAMEEQYKQFKRTKRAYKEQSKALDKEREMAYP